MLYLKEANFDDIEEEYRFITGTPEDENGFCNPDAGCTREQFEKTILPAYLKMAAGIDLPQGFVPETKYFLWDDGEIVGMFKLRHYLNDALREGAGHIGYGIRRTAAAGAMRPRDCGSRSTRHGRSCRRTKSTSKATRTIPRRCACR